MSPDPRTSGDPGTNVPGSRTVPGVSDAAVGPSDGARADLQRGLDRRRVALLGNGQYGAIVALGAGLVIAALLWNQDPAGTAVWLTVRVAVSIAVYVCLGIIGRRAEEDPHWVLTRYCWIAALGSTGWGLLPILVRPEEPEWQAMLVFALSGALCVVAAGYAVARNVFISAAAPTSVLGIIGLATFDTRYALVLCLAMVLAVVYTAVISVEANRVLAATLSADVENERLVGQLEEQRSDLREINDRLHLMVERQSMTLEERDALIAAVSHDLRSPLAAVSLMAETLAQRGDMMTEEQRRAMIRRIGDDAKHAAEVLADLASAQRLRLQDVVATRSTIDLSALLRAVVAAHPSEQHDIRVGEIAVGTDEVIADRVLVSRIVDNLVSNARKHTPVGSRIVVGARRLDAEVLVHVDDDGPGLPEPMRESVFEAYVRGTSATTRPGSGVGLFLVRTFAQLHGGRAWWEPSPIGGSRFVVSLPQDLATAAAAS